MSKNIKIKRSNGNYINCQPDGVIWISEGDRSFSSCGLVVHGVCNAYLGLGLGKKYAHYFPIQDGILKYAKKLHIKKIRITLMDSIDTRVGPIIKARYGYIDRSKFKRLLAKRKITNLRYNKVVLLKESDMVIKSH